MKHHWSYALAQKVISAFPDKDIYTCASGISPSGTVHAGNFRDIITSDAVYRSLKSLGKSARLLLSWDDFDRFRKIPERVPEDFVKYIGKPLSDIPDPKGEFESYARRYESEFENSLKQVGINPEIICQSKEYRSGRYDDMIKHCLLHRKSIATILAEFKTQGMDRAEVDAYFPISVYSRFTGNDNTSVLSFDGDSKITYLCKETGKKDTFDLTKDRIIKLVWKIDWPMRWKIEEVNFEPGGRDHASAGGSYQVGQELIKKIFNWNAPIFQGYDFIGIRGLKGKMSGSKGNVVTVDELLEIYEPTILRWMYLRYSPKQVFDFAFDSDVFRIYSEFDKEVVVSQKESAKGFGKEILELSKPHPEIELFTNPIPFRQISGYGQVVQFDKKRLEEILHFTGENYDRESIDSRLLKAKNWMMKYNPDTIVKLLNSQNKEYLSQLNSESIIQIKKLVTELKSHKNASIEELEKIVYSIPKLHSLPDIDVENKRRQREFFKDVYYLIIGKDTGPRLSTFLWAVERDKIIKLLDFD